MWKLAKYLKPYWLAVILAPLFMLIEVYMDLLQPKYMANIVNIGIQNGDLAFIQQTGLLMVGTALIGLIGGIGCTFFSSTASQSFGTDLRKDLFIKVQSFSFRTLDTFKAGSLVTRLTNDVVQVQNVVLMTLRILVRAPLLVIGSLIMAITISPSLALVLAAVTPILLIVLTTVIRKGFPLFSKVQKKLDSVNNVLQENLTGIRVVKAFVRADFENKRFGKSNEELMEIATKATRIVVLIMPLMMLIMNASIALVLWFGGQQVWSSSIQVGDLIAFLNYVTQMLFSLLMVSMVLMNVSRARASAERMNEVLETDTEIINSATAKTNVIRNGEVVFDNVSFAYHTSSAADSDADVENKNPNDMKSLVLKKVSFTAQPGKTIAILGATGSGKTSLVNLIPRLYDTTSGRILIDGTDVKNIDLQHLRTRIGVVLQEAVLFTGTIQENISFGKPDATQEEVEAAAKAAQAHDFIIGMPDGYKTVVGQRGVNLSGGQKQRISIARAILVKPPVLILDDSTSAVDLGTEARIQKALKEQSAHTTRIVIAQRISSVLEADTIIVLEDGQVVAEGNHAELYRTSAVYQDIYKSQLGEEAVIHG
ncbi:ABC transporter ATP-binding protein [Paenibacillus radicis (ex Xue et al. 2023)]|uniref:ABC transporter ATP-binding protein/permease n=1 Tax=Paenibacillus radicis (ex Xue et al. 2023) TaxID=2972489 RepID=A0ABT1YNI4_9BACL|nr:ABC transporter ATP-binding protein [Paenibacillus radicis (ex Xue et al. 2023)]MCR8634731.1 ABC transporter ATP-binding protein/permease [Paenibacillus radicis (ex Xue et al. 2023)]